MAGSRSLFSIALLLGERASAVRMSSESLDAFEGDMFDAISEEALPGLSKEVREMLSGLQDGVQQGEEAVEKVSCEELPERLVTVMGDLKADMKLVCIQGDCEFDRLSVDELLMAQGRILSLAAAADHHKCLPMLMGSEDVQAGLQDILSFVPSMMHDSATVEGRLRIQEAYLQLVSFMHPEGVSALGNDLVDRKLLHSHDISQNCPSPCQKCDFTGSSGFEFRCFLNRRDKNKEIQMSGVRCGSATRRGFLWLGFQRQCSVADWTESALTHIHVSAVLSCASTTMIMGLNRPLSIDRRREMHVLCMKTEQGENLTPDEKEDYEAQLLAMDDVVRDHLMLVFNNIMLVGMASGLAGLRAETRGNERRLSLLEEDSSQTDFAAVFLPFLADADQLGGQAASVRSEDLDMYANRMTMSLNREKTLMGLKDCSELYNMRSQNTLSEGAAPILIMSITIKNNAEAEGSGSDAIGTLSESDQPEEDGSASKQISWGTWILGGITGTWFAWMAAVAISRVFFVFALPVAVLAFPLIPLLAIGWIASIGTAVYGIYRIAFWFFGLFFPSARSGSDDSQILSASGLSAGGSHSDFDQCVAR